MAREQYYTRSGITSIIYFCNSFLRTIIFNINIPESTGWNFEVDLPILKYIYIH